MEGLYSILFPSGYLTSEIILLLLFSGSRQKIVDINLSRCFPEKPIEERNRIKRECYRNLGISLIEMAMCWWWSTDKLRPLVEIEGREHLDAGVGREAGRTAPGRRSAPEITGVGEDELVLMDVREAEELGGRAVGEGGGSEQGAREQADEKSA